MTITITHTRLEGTLVSGTSKTDGSGDEVEGAPCPFGCERTAADLAEAAE